MCISFCLYLFYICCCIYLAFPHLTLSLSPPVWLLTRRTETDFPSPIFPATRVLFPNFCQLSTPCHPIKTFEFANVICIYLCYIHSYEQSLFPLNSVNHRLLVFSIQSNLQISYEIFFIFGFFICVAMFSVNISSPHLIMTLFKLSKSTFNSSLWQLVEKFGNLIE